MIFLIVFIIMLNVTYLDSKIFIYYPFQNSYVKYKNIEIIGESDDFINYINVVNAKVIKSKVISKKYFYIKVSLKSKKNKIRLIFNKKSNAVLNINLSNQQNFFIHRFINITDCFSCHEKDLKKIKIVKGNCTTGICHQNILKHKHIHGPVGIKNCIACHTPHGSRSPKLLIKTGANLCYFCHKDKKQEFAKNFEHKPVRNGECIKCHDPHGSSFKYQLKVSCFSCHKKKKFTGKKFVHGPVGAGKCLSCHDPHASNKKFLIKTGKDFKILCFKCHEKKRFLSGKYVHGPVGGGLCTKCHSPHCSNNKNLLIKSMVQAELCFECHNRFKIIDSKYVHGPVGAGMCLSCHKIHSANYNYLLRETKKNGELCFLCHKDAQLEFQKRFIHKPVKEDCTNCHDAHSSPYKFQLIGDYKIDVCLKCHKDIARIMKNKKNHIHPIILEKGCKACHDPHASNYKYQLFNTINKLCKFCHVRFRYVKRGHPVARHPVKGRRNPLNRRKKFNCASCHNPHGSRYKFLLVGSLKDFEICRKCHINY